MQMSLQVFAMPDCISSVRMHVHPTPVSSTLRYAFEFLEGGPNVEQEATDAAHQHSIEALFAELTSMSSKLVTLSATLLHGAVSEES